MITYTWCMEVEYVLLDGVRKYDQTLYDSLAYISYYKNSCYPLYTRFLLREVCQNSELRLC